MARVYLGVGSNIERERYMVAGLDALEGLFGQMALSSVYDSAAIGFQGQPFLNMVVGVDTPLGVAELASKSIISGISRLVDGVSITLVLVVGSAFGSSIVNALWPVPAPAEQQGQ